MGDGVRSARRWRAALAAVLVVGSLATVSNTAVAAETTPATAADAPELGVDALVAEPPTGPGRDRDADGVSDRDERAGSLNAWPMGLPGLAVAGDPTDPTNPDSDDDGLSDGLELGTSADPRGSTATHTDPNRADTDGDGVDDAAEVAAHLDPLSADTDRDGLGDGDEADPDPLLNDADHDGAGDGLELRAGSDPSSEAGATHRYDDVPIRAAFYFPAYWALAAGVVGPTPAFSPNQEVTRSQLALYLRRYATFLGTDTTPGPNPFRDLRALPRRVKDAIAWVNRTGIIRSSSATRFFPTRTVARSDYALFLLRFAQAAGFPTAPTRDTFQDTARVPARIRRAIGWLQAIDVVDGRNFSPTDRLTRAPFATFLYKMNNALGVGLPNVDTDGDGLLDVTEQQGSRNEYPTFVDDDGDGLSDVLEDLDAEPDPMAPVTQSGRDDRGTCIAPTGLGGELPIDGEFAGGRTDLANPDSDGDGVVDGQEILFHLDPNDPDTDEDCIPDGQELIGWNIVVDGDGQGCPGGGGGGCPDIVRYVGHSDPLTLDGDGDGLADGEERLLRTDAELADTDVDGLDDFVEWNQWFTSPNSVDSDQDSRGGDHDLPPTESLFDGIELRDIGTSPTLDDTDGDGAADGDELDSPTRSPLLAELPEFDMQLAGGTSVLLRKEREASQGGAIEIGLTDSTESSSSTSNTSSVTQRETNTIGVEASFTIGYESGAVKAEATVGFSYSHEWGTDTTREFSSEESTTIAQERSRTESDEWTSVESAASGEISQGMVFTNTGTFTYELSDVGYSLLLQDPDTDEYKVVGTMTVPLDGITLGPGASTGPIQVRAQDLDVDLIQSFLSNPTTLHFVTGNLEFLDDEGRNFDFLTEQTFAQTAQVVVDFGEGRQEDFDVATNVPRAAPGDPHNALHDFPGIPMGGREDGEAAWRQGVMDQIGYPRCGDGVPAEGCYTTDVNGDLESVDGLANEPHGVGACPAHWQIIAPTAEQAATPFDSIVLNAGDRFRLVRQTDCDNDRLSDSVESGACLTVADCDGDGLTDLDEAEGWIVGLPDPGAAGAPCADVPAPRRASATDACPLARSNPKLADSDQDGVDDLDERDGTGRSWLAEPIDIRTDPTEPDTDGDTYGDACTPSGGGCAGQGDTAPLHSSLRHVDATPCGDGCWPTSSPDLGATLSSVAGSAGGDPRDDVRSVWVAEGTYAAPADGFQLPADVGVYGGFHGDETHVRDRNPDPNGTAAARLVGNGADQVAVVGVVGTHGALLDGFRVQGGTRGGVFGIDGDATLRNLLVDNNAALVTPGAQRAGGITWVGGHLVGSNLTVSTNTGPSGGVRAQQGAEVALSDSTIRSNESFGDACEGSPAPFCQGGGGVSVENATVTLDRVTVRDNTALVGGGIDVTGSAALVRVRTSDISRNTARGDDAVVGRGGGVHARDHARLLLSNCLVGDNQAIVGPRAADPAADGFGGGLFAFGDADVHLINCTVAGNRGGGVLVAGDERSSDDINPADPTLPATTSHLVYTVGAANLSSEVQRVTVRATGGTFRLALNAQTTAPLAFDASANAVQNALVALDNVEAGDVVVTGGPGDENGTTPYVLTWSAQLGNVAQLTSTAALSGGASTAVVQTTTDGHGEWRPQLTEVAGARATLRNTIVYGNTMGWQPTYIAYAQECTENRCPLDEIRNVSSGLLGGWIEQGFCLGGTRNSFLVYFANRACVYAGFAGLSFSSSTELRSDFIAQTPTRGVRAVNSMVGAGSRHGTNRGAAPPEVVALGGFCPSDYFGRTEVPTVSTERGSVVCEDDDAQKPDPIKFDIFVGLRGRGFVGTSVTAPVTPPASTDAFSDFYRSGYRPVAGSAAVNRGNEAIDWDPFTPGVQDPPSLDLAGNPRKIGSQIDLGPYEVG